MQPAREAGRRPGDGRPSGTAVPGSSGSAGTDRTAGADAKPRLARSKTSFWVEENDISYDRDVCLGKGGFGIVYRGKYLGLTDVAVKVALDVYSTEQADAFLEAEVKVWAELPAHRNVVPLLGYRTAPTLLITELFHGGSMKSFLEKKAWDRDLALRLLADAAVGMTFLHSKGVVHSDLKAENVLVDDTGGTPVAKIADFGLAKVRTRVEDTQGNKAYQYRGLAGATIRYAPPEFFEDEPLRKPSDVWTFAMMCYQVFSGGRDPYENLSSAPAIMKAMFRGDRPSRPDGVPDAVWELMVSCWAEEMEARPTMIAVATALKRVLEQPAVKKAVWVEVTDVEIFRDRPLGSGGFGEVFRGRFRGADVAVKVIDGTMEEDRARALFEAELKMWIDVPQHRNLVPLIAYRANPTFLVTELCSGGSLKSYLSSKGWPKPLSLQLLANAAAGIEVLHAAGIAHSDLKADNVLVSFDAAGNPVGRIADFGISKLRTRVHDSKGNKGYDYKGVYGATVRFAPPEFFDQEPMGRQSDVWTFGMMCYEVLSGGREPYEDLTSPAAVMRAIFTGSRPPQPPGISSAVWSLVEQCWREERSERPAMAELAEVLLEESASADQERRDREEREADARARRETEEQARKDAEKHARKKAEERARKEAEEQARKEAEEQARKEAEEQARKEAEERVRREREERMRREAEEAARQETARKLHRDAERRIRNLVSKNDVNVDFSKKLGEGSFGSVYVGTLHKTNRVAVKVLKGAFDRETEKQFLAEVEMWSGLVQRNIMPLMAVCLDPPMMISEIADGGNMRGYLSRMNWDQDLGLRLIWECSNVLVDEGRALITDFGLSHIRDRATAMEFEWNEGRAIGVFDEDRFVSPELMSGEPLRAPADTFAFAMLCYVVVSRGRYPFGDKSNGTALIYAVLHKDERPQRPEGTPNGVWQLMQQCWARDPAQRPPFATVRDQLQELRNSRAEVPAAVLYK